MNEKALVEPLLWRRRGKRGGIRNPPHYLFACDVRRRLTGVSLRAATVVTGNGVLTNGLLTARTGQHGALVNVLEGRERLLLIMMKKNLTFTA